jgi:hypothetical protein
VEQEPAQVALERAEPEAEAEEQEQEVEAPPRASMVVA